MSEYRKKPIVIEAVQWPGNKFETSPPEWFSKALYVEPGKPGFIMRWDDDLLIETLEGQMRAVPGDWIIRGIKGEIYPCKPEIFAVTYEAVAPMGTNGEAIPLPFDVQKAFDEFERLRNIVKVPGYCCGTKYTTREAFSMAIAPYAERIRHLERELVEWRKLRDPAVLFVNLLRGEPAKVPARELLNVAGYDQHVVDDALARVKTLERELEQARAAFIGSENARKDAERARGTVQSIDTPEFRALADKWQLCLTTDIERVYAELVAYIDGRSAGTAIPAGHFLVGAGTVQVNGGFEQFTKKQISAAQRLGSLLYHAAAPTPLNGKEEANG
jgi:hypothetical protein